MAGLSFLGQLDRIRDMPLTNSAPAAAAAQPQAEPSLEARQPASLSERVKQAFAAHHLPIHNKKDIPFTTIKVACPGAHSLDKGPFQGLHRSVGLDTVYYTADKHLETERAHGPKVMVQ